MNTTLFSVNNIGKIFPDPESSEPFTALSDIYLEIYTGQCILIAGSNGSGKTLLMKIIAGLLEPDSGDILFKGESLYQGNKSKRRLTERSLRTELGLVFQDADAQIVGETVFEDTVFGPENLGCNANDAAASAEKDLGIMGLGEKRHNKARCLSGGEKRRLAIAGILAMGCNTIIMDEPFANLDWPGVIQVLQIIRDLKKEGKTLIILTHELEKVLALSDRLVILHRGTIQSDGLPAYVLDNLDPAWAVRDPRRNARHEIVSAIEDCTWLAG